MVVGMGVEGQTQICFKLLPIALTQQGQVIAFVFVHYVCKFTKLSFQNAKTLYPIISD